MKFIYKTPDENGHYHPIQTISMGSVPINCSVIPESLDTQVFYDYNGFVNLTTEGEVVTSMEPNIPAWELWKASIPTPKDPTQAQLREEAYNTQVIIKWHGEMLTVTQAAQQWQYYAAEGDTAKTDELTALIAAAKETIREQWPDEEVTENE